MKIGILGWGSQGKSAFEYWNTSENDITICDADESVNLPTGVTGKLGKSYLENLNQFDLLIRTPALHPRDIVAANKPEILDKVWSNTNEFLKVCPTKNIIGVTGTKGKGTTSTLIAKILHLAGYRTHLGGNIGTPPLELLKDNIQPDDYIVLELANFQLIDLKSSPHTSVCLMVEPEHMDWHEDVEEYIAAKQQLFINQTDKDLAIYYAKSENSESIAGASEGLLVPYYEQPGAIVENDDIVIAGQSICSTNEIKLLGKHNWQNVCAAVTAVWFALERDEAKNKLVSAMRKVLTTFTGLEHRLELVKIVNNVKYYDDSFGTTPSTAQVAVEAFDEPKVVILGGSDKGATYDELAKTVAKSNVRHVITIGQTGPDIAAALAKQGYKNVVAGGNSMTEIADQARQLAQPGDIVLLSTGCASFGMFKDYKDRGEQFRQAVQALA